MSCSSAVKRSHWASTFASGIGDSEDDELVRVTVGAAVVVAIRVATLGCSREHTRRSESILASGSARVE